MPQLSAFLITQNEAADITGCLESLRGWVDEIVVVDDHSTDDTLEICRHFGAKTFTRTLDGFAAQKQFALDQTTGTWALSIDADERVPPALAREITSVLQFPTAAVGYEIRRNFYFLGSRLHFGGQGADWVLRLFRREKGRFRPVKVHERIEVDGPVERLSQPLEHYSYSSLEEYVEKCNHYTTLAAQEQWTKGRRFSGWDHLRPAWELFQRIVLKGAWIDGHAGVTYAALSAHAAWLRAIKLRDIERNSTRATVSSRSLAEEQGSKGPSALRPQSEKKDVEVLNKT